MNRRPFFGNWKSILPNRTRIVLLALLWMSAFASIALRDRFEHPGWDVSIYLQAVDSVRHHHDPYADAIGRQLAFHEAKLKGANGPTPFSYVYGPITLPVLCFVASAPLWLSGLLYWSLYLCGALAQIWGTLLLTAESERPIFIFFLPAAIFFPGMLASDIAWSGNVAFILYGAALAAALYGWSRDRWLWFYLVTIVASCFKAPMLTLLVVPVLTARNQKLFASIAALTGTAIFFSQSLFAPRLFHNYLQAVELQFSYNRDFGSSPAGLFSGFLYDHHLSYSPAAYFFWAAYIIPVMIVLVLLSRKYFANRIGLAQWVPVLLIGVILINPRILEYDENILAIPMALIVWRFFRLMAPQRAAIALSVVSFLAVNLLAYKNWSAWKLTEGPLLICCFAAGAWTLYRYCDDATARPVV